MVMVFDPCTVELALYEKTGYFGFAMRSHRLTVKSILLVHMESEKLEDTSDGTEYNPLG